MKLIIPLIMAAIFSSCNSSDFKVGDCVQKPDEVIVWKIAKVENEIMLLQQEQTDKLPSTQEVQISSSWIKSTCQN